MRFDNVWLRYGRRSRWVLQAVDVALAAGQIAVVVGRNGAGKTTLLSAAAGLLPPQRGRILDRPARIGWVPERFPANQPFTVGAYLIAMARSHGLSRAAATEEVKFWCERLFLNRYLDAHLADVSRGAAQKVGLIQGLIPRPQLLVLDEPWEGLDSQTRDLIPDIVAEVLATGGSVLVSDHLGEINRLPGALRWHVESGRVDHYEVVASVQPTRYVIEIGVAATEVPDVVAQLRGLGHEALKVRAARAGDTLPPLSDARQHPVPVEPRFPNPRHGRSPEPARSEPPPRETRSELPPRKTRSEPPPRESSRLTVLHRSWGRLGPTRGRRHGDQS